MKRLWRAVEFPEVIHKITYSKSWIHSWLAILIALIWFLLLLITIDRWKNLVFRSPSCTQICLDFCFHNISFLASCSSSSLCHSKSLFMLSAMGSSYWTSPICCWSRFILLLQHLKVFLFQSFNLFFVLCISLENRNCFDPCIASYQAFCTTFVLSFDLVQIASNLNGLFLPSCSIHNFNKRGLWSELLAGKWCIPALG